MLWLSDLVCRFTLLPFSLFLLAALPLIISKPLISPSQIIPPRAYLNLRIFRATNPFANAPCTGMNGTLDWLLANTAYNNTVCFDSQSDHLTCIERNFQQFDDLRIDTQPRVCTIEGFQDEGCKGGTVPARYNGAARWTWSGTEEGTNVKSFWMMCGEGIPA